MRNIKYLVVLGMALVIAVLVPAAHADSVTNLNFSASNGSGPFGTVTLHTVDANTVQVTVTLAAGNVFAVTGAGAGALGFSLDEAFTLASSPTLTPGFTFNPAAGSPQPGSLPYTFASGIGTYSSVIDCTVCGNGTSAPNESSFTFSVTNAGGLTFSDFVNGSGGFLFAADIGVPVPGAAAGNFNTFSVGGGPTVPTPEPGTFVLLGLGVVGLLALSRKRVLA